MKSAFRNKLLDGRVALVAGGTGGINLAIAEALGASGARVAVIGRDPERAKIAALRLEQIAPQAMALTADVRDLDRLSDAVSSVAQTLGPLDFVVAGAAGNFIAPAETLSSGGFRAVVDIDLVGTFHSFKAAFPHLADRASLLAISAGQATRAMWGQAHASAAKAGVEALVRGLALEWGPRGIRVNGLCPGPVTATEGVERLIAAETVERLAARMPLRRFADRAEIASAALFLMSPAASYITGTILHCDGGLALTAFDGQPD